MESLLKYQSKSITPVDEYECKLSDELKEIARIELHETDEARTNGITTMRDWIMDNPRILRCRMDANFILRFLRFRKYDIAETKEAFERFLIFREGIYDENWIKNLDSTKANIGKLIDDGAFYIFPERDSDGRLVILERAAVGDTSIPGIALDGLTLAIIIIETLLEDEENQIRGFTCILDFSGISIRHYLVVSFATWFRLAKNVEKTFAARHKGFHVVNLNPALQFLAKIVLKLSPKKLSSRAKFYTSFDEVDIVEKKKFPVECGGDADLRECTDSWKELFVSKEDFFLKCTTMKIDRSCYPTSVLNCEVRTLRTRLETPGFLKKKKHIRNRKVVVVSIIGAFRKGKSFFLNYCLRFLYANYPSINFPKNPIKNPKNWIGADTEPLQGFTWRSGTKRVTYGIEMWSDVFLHTVANTGKKIAIVVMDTQGLFDNETSPMDNSRIFALGTLISSIQIFNLDGIIQEDQLQYLQFATEFAKFASRDSKGTAGKPFQNLLFLLRDWGNPDEFGFGKNGGRDYLEAVLKVKPEQRNELKSVRELIMSSFEKVECSLMPHPGRVVVKTRNYDGQWKFMDEEFKAELVTTIENLLAPENLVLKKIDGKDLIGSELEAYMELYFELFQSDALPEPLSIYESIIDKQMNILINKCVDSYKQRALKNLNLLSKENLHVFHEMNKFETLLMFLNGEKMGTRQHEKTFQAKLEVILKKVYEEWKNRSLEYINNVEKEKAKIVAAMAEKAKLDFEMKQCKLELEKKLMESRLEFETERDRAVEAERIFGKAFKEP